MKRGKHLAVSLCGATGLVLTIFVIVLIYQITRFNLFAFNLYAVVPVGGVVAGLAACSGYYFSSIKFDVRPNKGVLLQIMIAAALAQFMIYYAEFRLMQFEDGTAVSSVMRFPDYLNSYLQRVHIYGGRGLHDLGAPGGNGWWLAAIDYFGFLLGGWAICLAMLAHPVCTSCACYLRKVASRDQIFSDPEVFAIHYQAPAEMGVARAVRSLLGFQPPDGAGQWGDLRLVTSLHCCPHCAGERIEQQVKILAAKGWRRSTEHRRYHDVPAGISLKNCFGSPIPDEAMSDTGASAPRGE